MQQRRSRVVREHHYRVCYVMRNLTIYGIVQSLSVWTCNIAVRLPQGSDYKSRKGSNFYEANDFMDDDLDSSSKRKDLIISGNRNDDSYEISTTGVNGAVCYDDLPCCRKYITIVLAVAIFVLDVGTI
uniref:Uncharacterized protein n=1 Tax=Anopheles stephensi TaxID=30069 RepID=A0A182YHC9_ANOST